MQLTGELARGVIYRRGQIISCLIFAAFIIGFQHVNRKSPITIQPTVMHCTRGFDLRICLRLCSSPHLISVSSNIELYAIITVQLRVLSDTIAKIFVNETFVLSLKWCWEVPENEFVTVNYMIVVFFICIYTVTWGPENVHWWVTNFFLFNKMSISTKQKT